MRRLTEQDLGELLERRIRAAGLSGCEVARRAGVSRSAVSRWRHGKGSLPAVARYLAALEATGVELVLRPVRGEEESL